MEYIYATMLLHKAGKNIEESNLRSVLEAAGVAVDESRIKALIAALEGIDIEDAIKSSAVMNVAAPTSANANVSSSDGQANVEKKEEKPKKEEKASAEEAAAGLGALFG